jgi:hypothetical protein
VTPTVAFIQRLEDLKEGERSRLRRLAGRPLDQTVAGFDLFTGLWWPLREKKQRAPSRDVSWLIAKLLAASSIPHIRPESGCGPSLPAVLGLCEPQDPPDYNESDRFRTRFDAILCSALADIEPRMTWALDQVGRAVQGRIAQARGVQGIDWALLLDDMSAWDRQFNPDDTWQQSRLNAHDAIVHCREGHRTPQDLWACEYLYAVKHQSKGANHADRNSHDPEPQPVQPQPR